MQDQSWFSFYVSFYVLQYLSYLATFFLLVMMRHHVSNFFVIQALLISSMKDSHKFLTRQLERPNSIVNFNNPWSNEIYFKYKCYSHIFKKFVSSYIIVYMTKMLFLFVWEWFKDKLRIYLKNKGIIYLWEKENKYC